METPPEPAAAAPHRLSVADLLLLPCATTGASSLLHSASSSSPPRKKLKHPTTSTNPNANAKPIAFAPISHPVLLAGTLSLSAVSAPAACRNHCLSFSDSSTAASVCCYLLDFDPAAVGREIRVLAWNYLPFDHSTGKAGGVLEVVRWCFAAPELVPKGIFLTTIFLNSLDAEPDLATRGRVFGVLKSVSLVFSVPHAVQSNVDRGNDSVGFLVEMMCCGCDQCRVLAPGTIQNHKFDVAKFLYFVELASLWRPVLVRLVGRLVSISELKKKMVFVGEKESHTMLVSTSKTVVAWCPSCVGAVPSDWEAEKCGGVFTGVVTGIYMQGMVVELDENAWLLMDNPQISPSHSLRVGAVISVRNFRAIRVNFAWTKVVLLKTCIRSSIDVNSFSLVDPKCHTKFESRGLLGKLIDSLEMSARFWTLLMMSCFKQKLSKLFSEKEIFGSKHKQGLVHSYVTKYLSSKDFQPQRGFFMRFCSHNCGNSSTESNMEACKLVIPFSNFIWMSESLWMPMILKFLNGGEELDNDQRLNQFLCAGVSYPGTTKRIISSDSLGFVLVGSITTSQSGRLQLVDATGCIDVVIPDIQPNAIVAGIYEITDYKLVLQGSVAYLDHCDLADPLSCKAVFQQCPYRRRAHHLMVGIIFYSKELKHIGPPSYVPLHMANDNCAGLFHLLKVSHKFPLQHQNMSGSSLYAEAMLLSYDLKFIGQGECMQLADSFRMACTRSRGKFRTSTRKVCDIPCSLSFRTTKLHGTLVSSYSCELDGTILKEPVGGESEYPSRILLEFKEGNLIKYQLLRIGAYYLLQCPTESLRCNMKSCRCLEGGTILIDSQDKFWSIAITFNGTISIKEATVGQEIGVSLVTTDGTSSNTVENELKLLNPWNDFPQHSDFHLDLSCEATSERTEQYDIRHHLLNGLCSYSSEVLSVSSCVQIMMTTKPYGFVDLQTERLVQGDLISLKGKVENIHLDQCKEGTFSSSKYMSGMDGKHSICIHLADDNHMLRLRGYLSKHAYPVGIGPGARVMIHRVLFTQGHELLVSPVTYIEVISISQVDQNEEESIILPSMSDLLKDGSLRTVLPCLFSHQMHHTDDRPMGFRCRVVAILMLVLENYLPGIQKSEATKQSKMPKVKIPLAGFILDDGSSLCCCWADGARAELLLRLQEVAQLDVSDLKFLKEATNRKLRHSIGCYLEKMLKNHKKVIMKNYRNAPDFSCRDLEFSSVLHEVFSGLEEKILKFIILNACQGAAVNVIASVLNPKALNRLGVNLSNLSPARDMPNMWINEVSQIDPLEEARSLYGNL